MDEKTTSTNARIGDEGYKGSDLSEIEKIDRRETSINGAEQDILLTRELCMCGLMGIEVSDHIIRIRDHVSLKESRLSDTVGKWT